VQQFPISWFVFLRQQENSRLTEANAEKNKTLIPPQRSGHVYSAAIPGLFLISEYLFVSNAAMFPITLDKDQVSFTVQQFPISWFVFPRQQDSRLTDAYFN
jgi:hypothetical protein